MSHQPMPPSSASPSGASPSGASASTTVTTRRQLLALAAVGGAGLVTATAGPAAAADKVKPGKHTYTLSVLGTTDLHGNVFNWDYFKDAEYTDSKANDVGLAKVSSLVAMVRAEKGAENCLLLDAGDTIQGTPLAYYYAKIDPITQGAKHPMAAAMNAIGYDAAALGNHEYNYGLDTLRTFEEQCDFPLLSANSVDWDSGAPVFPPYAIRTVRIPGQKPLTVGILGLVTPGVAIWDHANVDGRVKFPGIVEQGAVMVPKLKAAGCDLVIVACHSGATPGSSYGDALPFPENASTQLAEEVPGIDAILVGHAHVEIPQAWVTNKATGKQVLLSEPLKWGMRLTVMDFDVQKVDGEWQLTGSRATLLNANVVPEDPAITAILSADHELVRTYVNSVIGTCTAPMSALTSRFEDTAAMDFINHVQAGAVKAALAGTPDADLPMLSIAAPFNRDAAIPSGEVTVRDVAGLYIYDNTLLGVRFTGAQVKAYLEWSARYFKQVSGTGPFAPDDITNAVYNNTPTPDYNYDIMGGLDASLAYDIDIAQPAGQRITNLTYAGQQVAADGQFIVAINNYRQGGGGNFPGTGPNGAPVVYNAQVEIRQMIIDWVTAQKVIDPSTFTTYDWRLVSAGEPVVVEGAAEGGHH